jgi:penicillin-insensitive murein endopeptidase
MRPVHAFLMVSATLAIAATAVLAAADDEPAKKLFSEVSVPSPGASRAVGSYAEGCLAGAVALPADGPHWAAMRPSRNRAWGTPQLVSYIETLANDAAKDGWPGLLVGDMAQPRGGPMPSGHASHQIGLDVDIWYLPLPDHLMTVQERETVEAPSVLVPGKLEADPAKWTPARTALLKRAASYPDVARIFVSAAIKKTMCQTVTGDRAWMSKIRPWTGHDDHFHVRLTCPAGMASCVNQAPVDPGDGCGADLAEWFKPAPPEKPPAPPFSLPPEVTLADLPAACTPILTSAPGGLPPSALKIPTPLPRPRPGGS